jgi:hypothetical protein
MILEGIHIQCGLLIVNASYLMVIARAATPIFIA